MKIPDHLDNLKGQFKSLLVWSQKYTKTDMVYLAKGGFWLTASQGVSILAGFILLVSFANLLPTETYGTYRYILAILGVIVIGTFPGINVVSIKTVAEENEEQYWQLLSKKALFSLLSSLLSFLTSVYYLLNHNEILSLAFLIVGFGLPLVYTSGMYEALLYGRKNFKRAAQLNMLNKIIVTAFLVLTVYFTDNIIILILAYFIPETIIQTIYLTYFFKKRPTGGAPSTNNQLTKFGIHLSMMDVLKTVAGQIDKMLVFHYLGATQLAIYAIATTPPSQIKNLMQNLTTLAFPKMSTATADSLRETLPNKLFRLEMVIIGLIIIYWLAAPVFFPLFFPKYVGAILLSQVYALSLIFFPRTFLSTAMTAQLKQKELYFIRIIAPTLRIIIFLLVLPIWGMWGAVIGSIVGNALTSLIYTYFFAKAFPKTTPPLS
ncbi:MAG: hypothetical protein A2589_02200 [Candidatus Vogelbacteria bacterium RIFOXYD1_FULL_46_19]|uniref:Polysaccharide biosynthesis protein C-terminal domain-containing protein n=1 Tax=Candidatus Vogelbacteria bacterium RIFOXYD1_FULL_46_19 TaxID=1802439 RepID=A0A1G2QGL6_9BACT|nr:MAG: hypothetical protein A2589_02200 [Candidatus Vogelbacteria bacterium RIFOXYD1_FULL_46_19]